jgi:MFS family permease
VVLFGGTFVNRLGTFVMPFITLYLTQPEQGYSVPQAGLALAMYGIGGVAAQFLGGWLADRIGRRNAIGFSMLGASVITLALWQASSLLVIYALMLLLALVAEMHRPAASALIADLVPSKQRVTAFAVFRLAINVGWAFGLTLGGLLADASFSYLFVGDAATSAAFGWSLIALPHGTRVATRTPSARRDTAILAVAGSAVPRLGHDGATIYKNVSTFRSTSRRPASRPPSTAGCRPERGDRGPARAAHHLVDRAAVADADDALAPPDRLSFASLMRGTVIPALAAMVLVWTLGNHASPVSSAFVADRSPGTPAAATRPRSG